MLLVGQLLLSAARCHPHRLAVASRYGQMTYEELNTACSRVANGLRAKGIKKGDTVAMLLKNGLEWVTAWFACQKLGAAAAPLHARLRDEELAGMMELSACSALIYSQDFEQKVLGICQAYGGLGLKICVGGSGSEWEELLSWPDAAEAQAPLSGEDAALTLFTSGTTGAPKGVVRSQEMTALHGLTLALRNNNPRDGDVMMSTSPLYHIGGLQGLLKMAALGCSYVTLDRIEPAEILDMIERYGVTQLQMLPPVTYERIYNSGLWRGRELSGVWEVCISAGKCALSYAEHIFEMFPNCHLRPSWGSTETCSVTCMQLSREELARSPALIDAVGRVLPLTELRIVDKSGADAAPGEPGEALVRSPMVFRGYLQRAGGDCDPFTADGWYMTGDIMRLDAESGCYYFVDRKKDVIKTGGENVFASEIEEVIEALPSVEECAVVGVPDERFGEGIAAAVVPRPGCRVDAGEVVALCRRRLPSFKKPRYLAVLPKLPTNSVGKVQKNELRQNASLFSPLF